MKRFLLYSLVIISFNLSANNCNQVFQLIKDKDVTKLRIFLNNNKIDLNACYDAEGYTPLLEAVDSGNVLLVKSLLEHKADPNKMNQAQTRTPLINAISLGNDNIVRILLDYGADPALSDKYNSPLGYAKKFGRSKIEDMLNKAIQTKRKTHLKE